MALAVAVALAVITGSGRPLKTHYLNVSHYSHLPNRGHVSKTTHVTSYAQYFYKKNSMSSNTSMIFSKRGHVLYHIRALLIFGAMSCIRPMLF